MKEMVIVEDYNNISKQELVKEIDMLKEVIKLLKEEKDQEELLTFPWIGNLGNWHWNVQTDTLICNKQKYVELGYSQEEVPDKLGFKFFTSKLHPDDYEKVMENMESHLKGDTEAYEVEYRIQTKSGEWIWYYDRGKATKRDSDGNAILLSGIVFNVTEKNKMKLLIEQQNKKLKEQNKQLKEIVDYDCLTNTFNRRALLKKLDVEMEKALDNGSKLSIVMMDIDKFSLVNNMHGHLVGDRVLEETTETIKGNMLGKDILGRYGGEEFLVILPNTGKDKAIIVAERIREAIEGNVFTKGVQITISGGVEEYDGGTIESFIDKADGHLYKAKESGRNKICYN